MSESPLDLAALERFIVAAKAETYVGEGVRAASSRPGSHDLAFAEGDWSYLDSYLGGTDFVGEEAVWLRGHPVWAMNYYGRILEPQRIDAERAGRVIKESLSALYREGRFLGGFRYECGAELYVDASRGDVASFRGEEWIEIAGLRVYELLYHGGLVKD
ncbi:MAG: DUF5680 domain-containing protein [Gaiellaceae bacterium]